jgi:hypothetical protein
MTRHYTPAQREAQRNTPLVRPPPDLPIAQAAAVRCHRKGCDACRYRLDCAENVKVGGACLGEAVLVGEP